MPNFTLAHALFILGLILLGIRIVMPTRPNLERTETAIFIISIVILFLSIVAILYTLMTNQ